MADMVKREQYETERLCIRHFDPADVDSCYNGWGQDEQLGKFISGYPMTKETMESFVMTIVENQNVWVIAEKKSSRCIGYVTVDIPYPQLAIGEIGYVIGEHFQRKGYAYEAVSELLRIYLEEKSLYMMEAKYNINNVSSEKLLKKLGFVTDGILRNRRIDLQTGQRCDLVVCSICWDMKEEIINIVAQEETMKNTNQLIGCCGLDCEKCDARIATITNDNTLREKTAALWTKLNGVTITPEMINCTGCRIEGVKTPFCDKLCPIHNCVRENGLDTCADCLQMDECPMLGRIAANSPSVLENLNQLCEATIEKGSFKDE